MRRIIISLLAAVVLSVASVDVGAQQTLNHEEVLKKIQGKLRGIRRMAFHPVIVRAVQAQNNQKLTMEVIEQRDTEWRSSQEENSLQRSITNSEASEVLRTFVERNPDYSEAFATDNQGANVAMYPVTSDYWQGDEDKWINSFNGGDGKVWIGGIELDESTNLVAVQVSVPILDQGETIGVLVVGVTQEYLDE